ncbi:MAG: amidohydrolase family protein [Planctomycetes bacterium]|nr:amidohydrolase family protein [Planctomycetota bacterium]
MQLLFRSCAVAALACGASALQNPQAWAVKDVRLEARDDAPRKTLFLRDGHVDEVLEAGAQIPDGLRVLDGHGMLALPAFVDAYSFAGCPPPAIVAQQDLPVDAGSDLYIDMRAADRKGIAPAYRAAEHLALDEEMRGRWRSSGFSHLLSAPHGELLAGMSALACTRTLASRDAIVRPVVFDHASFECDGPGYPGTLMGAFAQLRQFFMDARWAAELGKRAEAGESGPRPPFDLDLQAILPALGKQRRVVCEAETAADIERWIRLSDEFGFQIAIAGGREAWKLAALLAQHKIPVLLTLEWGDEPEDPHAKEKEKEKDKDKDKQKDEDSKAEKQPEDKPKAEEWTYSVPLRVREERRRLWEADRDGAQRLAQAGVEIAFVTGKSNPKDLLERVRTLVEKGLPLAQARAALTNSASELLGSGKRLGSIESGAGANLALWTADPLSDKEARLGWLFVEGWVHEFEHDSKELQGKPAEGLDASGKWNFTFEGPRAQPGTGELVMKEDGSLSATLHLHLPGEEAEQQVELTGKVAGRKLHLEGRIALGKFELALSLDGTLEAEKIEGTAHWKGSENEDSAAFHAVRAPKREELR